MLYNCSAGSAVTLAPPRVNVRADRAAPRTPPNQDLAILTHTATMPTINRLGCAQRLSRISRTGIKLPSQKNAAPMTGAN